MQQSVGFETQMPTEQEPAARAITKRLIESGSPPDAARQLAAKLKWPTA